MKNESPSQTSVISPAYKLVQFQKKEDSLEKNCIIPIETASAHLGILLAKNYTEKFPDLFCTDVLYLRRGKKNVYLHFDSVVLQSGEFFTAKVNEEILPSPSKMPYLVIEITEREYAKAHQNASKDLESVIEQFIPTIARNAGFSAKRKNFFGPYELTSPETYARYEALWMSLPNRYRFNGMREDKHLGQL